MIVLKVIRLEVFEMEYDQPGSQIVANNEAELTFYYALYHLWI